MEISLTVIISSAVLTALFFLLIIGLGLKAQRGKPVTGMEGIIGEIGETITPLDPNGKVRIHGEIWNAVSSSGSIKKGKAVKVIGIENLKLFVQEVQ
jgi:membrane-bound serine protease (ClpP class)